MNKKFFLFGSIIGFYYIVQFMMCVSCCNLYSDISRLNTCIRKDGTRITGAAASAVYDRTLYLVGIFHIIEWIRSTILLSVICIGANLMNFWYLSCLNMFYGLACLIIVHITYSSTDGKACASA